MSGRFFHSKRSKINTLLPSRPSAQSLPSGSGRAARPSSVLPSAKPYKKGKIPKALREALWLKHCGKSFEVKCHTTWCQNLISAYDFQAGHNVPECRGGATTLDNLMPICSRCNLSMGSQYTFDEWCRLKGSATLPASAPAAPAASLWCCTWASCVEMCIEPAEEGPQVTVHPNPLPTVTASASGSAERPGVAWPVTQTARRQRRVSPSPAPSAQRAAPATTI